MIHGCKSSQSKYSIGGHGAGGLVPVPRTARQAVQNKTFIDWHTLLARESLV